MFTAPQNSIRPIPTADFVTFSDLFLLLGAGLLLPTLLQRRGRYPALFLVGAVGLSAMVLIAATIGPTPLLGLLYGLRLPAAAVALPVFFLAWRPQGRLIEALAWAYVAGHVVSTCYAVVEGRALNDRYDGLTTHFNFFGIAALVASTMLVHLYHATPRRHRWVPMVAALFCAASISMSGSRAAAIVVAMILVLYPLLERSVVSAYLLIAGRARRSSSVGRPAARPVRQRLGHRAAAGRRDDVVLRQRADRGPADRLGQVLRPSDPRQRLRRHRPGRPQHLPRGRHRHRAGRPGLLPAGARHRRTSGAAQRPAAPAGLHRAGVRRDRHAHQQPLGPLRLDGHLAVGAGRGRHGPAHEPAARRGRGHRPATAVRGRTRPVSACSPGRRREPLPQPWPPAGSARPSASPTVRGSWPTSAPR